MSTHTEYPMVSRWILAQADLIEAEHQLDEIRAAASKAYAAAAQELIDAGFGAGEALIVDNLAVYLADDARTAGPMGPKLEIIRVPTPKILAWRKAIEGWA